MAEQPQTPMSREEIIKLIQDMIAKSKEGPGPEHLELVARVTKLEKGVGAVVEEIKKLMDAAGPGTKPTLPPDPQKRDFLSLELRDTKLDPITLQALGELNASSKVKREDVIASIIKGGAGANAQKIVRALSRKRLPDMTCQILDVVLPGLLDNQFGKSIKEKETEDTVGATSALLTRLRARGGPLEKFSEILVKRSNKSLQIDMGAEQAKLMTERIYQSLI